MSIYTHSQRIFFQYAGQQVSGVHIRVGHARLFKPSLRQTQRFADRHAEAPSFFSSFFSSSFSSFCASSGAFSFACPSPAGSGFFSFVP